MPRNAEIKARIDSVDTLAAVVAGIADSGPTEIIPDDTFFRCDNGRLWNSRACSKTAKRRNKAFERPTN